jgi:hypothetical protein
LFLFQPLTLILLKWALLNGIMVNTIIPLMGSIEQVPNDHSVNGISYGLAQSDPIKRRPQKLHLKGSRYLINKLAFLTPTLRLS